MFCGIKLDNWSHLIPQIRWLKPQKIIFSQLWRLEVSDKNASRTAFSEASPLGS